MATTVNLYTTPEELNTLHSAEQVKSVSEASFEIQERSAVARLINLAANTGEKTALWNHPLSVNLKKELESQGYKVIQPDRVAKENTVWQISWE